MKSAVSNLVDPLKGYSIEIVQTTKDGRFARCIGTLKLEVSKVGGAHIVNDVGTVRKIEDIIFKQEQMDAEHDEG